MLTPSLDSYVDCPGLTVAFSLRLILPPRRHTQQCWRPICDPMVSVFLTMKHHAISVTSAANRYAARRAQRDSGNELFYIPSQPLSSRGRSIQQNARGNTISNHADTFLTP